MKVKIDTKEKFHVITPEEPVLSANMTEEFKQMLLAYLEKEPRNIVLNLAQVKEIARSEPQTILLLQQSFYEKSASFVVCGMGKEVEDVFEQSGSLDLLNFTSTESEAWDIVQMEEIEREFLD